LKSGYLIINAFAKSDSFSHLEASLTQAAERACVRLTIRTNASFIRLPRMRELPDFALFFDKDIRLAQQLEALGLRLYNRSRAIALCDDKTLTYLALKPHGIPMPPTIICPQTFPDYGYGDMKFLDAVSEELGYPYVIKEGCGSFGQQVYLAQNRESAEAILTRIGAVPALFQKYIVECTGSDIRIYVVGGQAVASVRRINKTGDFRANVAGGGIAEAYSPTKDEKLLAVSTCSLLGLDFAGVDILQSSSGPLLCEVNSNAHFRALSAASGIDPADAILRHIQDAL
jgi:RimK family alpha-L-glutamate ligase